MAFKIGDIVFFTLPGSTGEGMFIGRLRASPADLVLVIGKQVVELADMYCTPTKRGLPAEGESWRRDYLKQRPGSLV